MARKRSRSNTHSLRTGEPFSRSTAPYAVPRPVLASYPVSQLRPQLSGRQAPSWRDFSSPQVYVLFLRSAPRDYPTQARSRVPSVRFHVPASRRQVPSKVSTWRDISRALRVRVPNRVYFCVQRQQRKQVLFALGRAGYSGSARKRHYNRTQNSQYRC